MNKARRLPAHASTTEAWALAVIGGNLISPQMLKARQRWSSSIIPLARRCISAWKE